MKPHARHSIKWEAPLVLPVLPVVILFVILGCAGQAAGATAAVDSQATFATPVEAGEALQAAARADNEVALTRILGPRSKAILSSGDPDEDKASLQSFVIKYDRMNRWVAMTDSSQVLYIGADNYPYPIPLVQNSSSKWYFNTSAGEEEILARRIGRNELRAIDACYAMANAEELYLDQSHDGEPARQYTAKIVSTAGRQDGLYWPTSAGQPSSPLSDLAEFARYPIFSASPDSAPVMDGYKFRVLTAQGDDASGGAMSYLVNGKLTGGFAIIASPVKYRDSGVMTFLLSREGVVYQKDLGEKTTDIAASIKDYNPTQGWTPAE
jgi:Protein of unknown function (DUF2950)